MTLHAYTHIALRVESLRGAEDLYCRLFALDVAWREAETGDGWRTLPPGAGWDEADEAGIELGILMLHRDGFRLALEATDAVAGDGRLDHIGVYVDEEELERLRSAVREAGCNVAVDRPQALIFTDPLGVSWEVNSFPYDDPVALSTGARTGRWLELA